MKYLKWAALVLVALAIIAAVVQWRRDTIALGIANRVLKDTDFVVASISVRKLGVDHVELSSIVLETPEGARYDVAGLDYPLKTRDGGPRRVAIQDLALSWSDGGRAKSYTDLARTFLALPETLANTDVQVQRLSVQALPELQAISWTTSGAGQTFAAEVAGLVVSASVARPADDTHEARIGASDAAGNSALRGSLLLTDREQRVAIEGNLQANVAALEPLLRALEWLPAPAEQINATVAGPIAVDLDVGGDGNVAVRFEPTLSKGSSLSWRGADDKRTDMALDTDTRLDVVLSYPSLLWTLDVRRLQGTLRFDDGTEVRTTLSDMECRAGMQCTLRAAARAGPVAWGDLRATAIDVTEATGVTLGVEASGWSAEIERLDVTVEELRPAERLLVSSSLVVSNLDLADGLSSITAEFRSSPGAGRLQYGDIQFAVPGAQGTVRLVGGAVASSLQLFDKSRSLSAGIDLGYDLAAERGSARIRDAVVDFGRRKLSQRVIEWPYPWDVIAGAWSIEADIDWEMAKDGAQYRGSSTHRLEGLAGIYNDIGMAGMGTSLRADIDSAAPLAIYPAMIRVDLIDVGVPIRNIIADVALDIASSEAKVNEVSGEALGGRFSIAPFKYLYKSERNDLQVNLEHVQPQFMVDLASFEKLKITGTMSGMLPVTLVEGAVRVENGLLTNDPPGGVIRYGDDAAAASNSQLAMVTGALSNFVYDSLTARVDYTEAGDLKLGMRLKGVNPDRDPTQPIILNLNIDNNIPQMLRSLQAVRSIEDILERRTAR